MDITFIVKRFLMFLHIAVLVLGACVALPAIRVREPEFEPVPSKITHKKGDKARLFCSVKHLGERTVVWRKVPEKNPLTIGMTTYIEDPRISIEHDALFNQWDLVIENVSPRDAGEYECQVSISKKKLRHVVELYVTETSSNQVKRNPEIVISGTQFVTSGDDINLYCNASVLGNPRRVLIWSKDTHQIPLDEGRISLSYIDTSNREQLSSKLFIQNSRPDDSGLYTCRSRDNNLMTSAQVNVLTGGSNNVKRAGSNLSSQESKAVLSVQCAISHSTFILLVVFVHWLLT